MSSSQGGRFVDGSDASAASVRSVDAIGSARSARSARSVGDELAPTKRPKRWLVALDIDGTVMREDGVVTETTVQAIRDAEAAGHEVMLSTGRSEGMTVPVLDTLGVRPKYLVCANGALTLQRDESDPTGYRRVHVETFDPTDVLQTIQGALSNAAYGVEDAPCRRESIGPPVRAGTCKVRRVVRGNKLARGEQACTTRPHAPPSVSAAACRARPPGRRP